MGSARRFVSHVVTVLGYLIAAAVGIAIGALVVDIYNTLSPLPMISTLPEANSRQVRINTILVIGLVLGPALWHIRRVTRS